MTTTAATRIDDSVAVIIGGNASQERGPGYWQTQYRPRPTALQRSDGGSATWRSCAMSARSSAKSALLNTVGQAFDVMTLGGNGGSEQEKLDRELLTAWLNFANGAFGYDELVDTGDGGPGTAFSAVMAAAEAARTNPAATAAQLRAQRIVLQR